MRSNLSGCKEDGCERKRLERKEKREQIYFALISYFLDLIKKHVCIFALKNMNRNLQFVVHGCLHDGSILDDIWHATLWHLLS